MIEVSGDLFEQECDAICITTNGDTTHDGLAVMGAGCAWEALKRWPGINWTLAHRMDKDGNNCHFLTTSYPDGGIIVNADKFPQVPYHVLSFPTKNHWRDDADPILVARSARQLMAIIEKNGFKKVMLPRPGCGYGRLKWEFVWQNIFKILDDRVYVITRD
jgi:hypothetical protein